MNQTTKGIGIALIGSACFGLAGPLAKMIYAYGVTPSFMLAVRFGIAAIVLWLYVAVNRQKIDFHMDRHQLLLLFFLGAICNVVGTATYFVALETVPVSLGIMIFYTYPFVVNLLTVMIYHHKIALLQKLALAAAFGGLLLMLSLGNKAPSLPGVLLCFVSGLSSCVYVLLLERPRIQGLPVVLMTAVVNSFSSLSFWVYCAVAGQVEFALPGMAWLYLALLALFPTSLGVLCWTRGVRMIGAAKASIIGVFEPLEGVLIGCIFLAEGMNGLQLLGAVLIASAIVLINKAGQQENKCRGIAVKKSMKMV